MEFYQIALAGHKPSGGLFESRADAERERRILIAEDRRYAADALAEAGIIVEPSEYVIHVVQK